MINFSKLNITTHKLGESLMDLFNPYKKLLYKRGFIFSNKKIKPPHNHWISRKINDYWLYHDPLLHFVSTTKSNSFCGILGYVFDILDPTKKSENITSTLLDSLLKSKSEFLDGLDLLSGRFLVILYYNNEFELYQDACGLRSVYYSTESCVVSSHVNLLIDNLENVEIDERFTGLLDKYTSYHLPGHFTNYKNVFILTPNTFLNVPSMQVKRFFPREDLVTQQPEKVYEITSELLHNQIKHLVENYQLLISLTAGLDSRATLSLTKNIRDRIQYFTYFKSINKGLDPMIMSILERDKETVQDLIDNLDINHLMIDINYEKLESRNYKQFSKMMKKHTYIHHNHYLAWQYYSLLPKENLHIRSTVNGIFRKTYDSGKKISKNLSPTSMTYLYSPKATGDERIHKYFEEYADVSELDKIFNYDPYVLFYWSYRLGAWHSNILLESDISFDTFCLFNNRILLNTILSLPDSYLEEDYVLRKIITNHWPVLNFWEVNSKGYSLGNAKKYFDELAALDIEGNNIYSGNLIPFNKNIQNGIISFYMDVNAPKEGDVVTFRQLFETIPNQGYILFVSVQSPYMKPKNIGRMDYRLLINGTVIMKEDIALWGLPNGVTILFQSKGDECLLEVKIFAIKDCEPWSWGRAGEMKIKDIELKSVEYSGPALITTSSPYTQKLVGDFSNVLHTSFMKSEVLGSEKSK